MQEKYQMDWDSVSNGYRKWWRKIEGNSEIEGAQKVSLRLLELAKIRPGHTVLDIATGYGEPAVSAAQCVGSKGYVLAIDASPKDVRNCKREE